MVLKVVFLLCLCSSNFLGVFGREIGGNSSSMRLLERIQETIKNPHGERRRSLPTLDKSECENATLVSRDLPFGDTLRLKNNLTWGEDVLKPLLCATEYVLLYTESGVDASGAPTKNLVPLCRSFDVAFHPKNKSEKDGSGFFSCAAGLNETKCGEDVIVVLEVWLVTGKLLQASSKLNVVCGDFENDDQTDEKDTDDNDDEDEEESFDGPPLVLASVTASCAWTQWSGWSDCPISCGDRPGIRTRSRGQIGSKICVKSEKEEKPCLVNKCPQDCAFKPWSEWTDCSMTCGSSGVKTRTRAIDRYQEFGGKPCTGDRTETENCSGGDCAVDGEWSDWRAWSYCDAACGEGRRNRTRSCDSPKPENGGKICEGEDYQEEACKIKDCAKVDGNWSPWSRWSGCSRPCGPGVITRTRTCSNPRPEHGGKDCEGKETKQRKKCFLKSCLSLATTTTTMTTETSSTTSTTTTERTNFVLVKQDEQVPRQAVDEIDDEEEEEEEEVESCLFPAPRIVGFLGPFKTPNFSAEEESFNLTVPVGGHAFYRCHSGKVVDVRTNVRHFALPCLTNRTFPNSSQMPVCQSAKYCIGPLPVRQDSLGKLMGFPRRDQKVNTPLLTTCRNGAGVASMTPYGSCFSDGVVRYPGMAPCLNPSFAPTSAGSSNGIVIDKCVDDQIVEVVFESERDYGWLQYEDKKQKDQEEPKTILDLISNGQAAAKTGNPINIVSSVFETLMTISPPKERNNTLLLPQTPVGRPATRGSRCRYLLKAPDGHALRLGIEWLPRTVRLTDVLNGEELSLYDVFNSGHGSVTSEGSVVAVEARMRPGERFRMNYRVVVP